MITGLVRVSPSLHFWKKHCPIHRQLVGQNSVTGNVDSLCAPEEKELGWASSQSAITGKPPGIPGTTERLHDKKKKKVPSDPLFSIFPPAQSSPSSSSGSLSYRSHVLLGSHLIVLQLSHK